MTLGDEFSGYAACIERAADDLEAASAQLTELNLGATAVGTGLNAGSDYAEAAVNHLRSYTNLPLRGARNLLPRHSKHGRHRRLFRSHAPVVDRARKNRERSALA